MFFFVCGKRKRGSGVREEKTTTRNDGLKHRQDSNNLYLELVVLREAEKVAALH